MAPVLAAKGVCTGCGACAAACPKCCVEIGPDALGVRSPSVDLAKCVGCGACARACHALGEGLLHERSEKVLAAWQSDDGDRRTSASGGVASACYRWALDRGMRCYGVPADGQFDFRFVELAGESDVLRCKNSKYAESDMSGVFAAVREQIRRGEDVLFVGLPCQVAALRTFVGGRCEGGLTTVDIICHGVCPAAYLEEHVRRIEEKRDRVATGLCFRDPDYRTFNYRFTLADKRGRFYSKGPKSDDAYQVGYHSALTYRENCYACRYARDRRGGDLTIGDFSGYGRHAPATASADKVSCVIASTPRGERMLGELAGYGIVTERRDPREAFLYERQLRAPSVRHAGRAAFLEAYAAGSGFDGAVRAAMGGELLRNGVVEALRLRELGQHARTLVPKGLKRAVKRCLKRD